MHVPYFLSFVFILLCCRTGVFCQSVDVKSKINGKTSISIRDTINSDTGPIYVDTFFVEKLPPQQFLTQNYLGKSLMTPTAWGGPSKGGLFFVGLGGTFPQLYTSKNDLIGVAGLSAGNPDKFIGVSVMLNINDISKFRNFSSNLILYKHLSMADAISVGGIHLLRSWRSDSGPSYYVVYSHAVQTVVSKKTGASALSYSIGVGSGRFWSKSPKDRQLGKGRGTAVFANVSYELTEWLNANVEWSGTNLHAGVSIRPISFLPFINLGLADITRLSGQQIRFVSSLGFSVYLWK